MNNDTHTHTHTCMRAHTHTVPGLARAVRVSGRAACTTAHLCYSSMSWRPGSRGRGRVKDGEKESLHGFRSTPTLLPSAHPSPLAHPHPQNTHTHTHTHTHNFPFPQTRLSRHLVPAPAAWVSAKEDTWRDRYTKGSLDPADLSREGRRQGGGRKQVYKA